jgi:hypothetical protein
VSSFDRGCEVGVHVPVPRWYRPLDRAACSIPDPEGGTVYVVVSGARGRAGEQQQDSVLARYIPYSRQSVRASELHSV